jgi:hypothetical protein
MRNIFNIDESLLEGLLNLPQELLDRIFGLLVLPNHQGYLPPTMWLRNDNYLISPSTRKEQPTTGNLLPTLGNMDGWDGKGWHWEGDQFCHVQGFAEALHRIQQAGNADSNAAGDILRRFLLFLGSRTVLQAGNLGRSARIPCKEGRVAYCDNIPPKVVGFTR